MYNPTRRKITDLYVLRYRTKEYRDSEGKLQHNREPYWAGRPVEVVDGWARFGHYLLDAVFIWVLGAVFGLLLGIAIQQNPAFFSMQGGRLELNFIGTGISFGYYMLFELLTSSTPAKLILGRTVVNEYGEKIDGGQAALRSLIRLIPFEAFSCLGERGWHDRWTKTFVVRNAEKEELQRLLVEQSKEDVQRMSEDYLKQQVEQMPPTPPPGF